MSGVGEQRWNRCFHGTIKREINSDGSPVVNGRIKVLDGFICTQAANQHVLGERLDEMVLIVLETGLHCDKGNSIPNGNISLN